VNGFTDHLHMTWNYKHLSTITGLQTSQISRAHAKSSQSASISCFLVTDLNNADSSASVVMPWPAS
jgi:hypothetical protein